VAEGIDGANRADGAQRTDSAQVMEARRAPPPAVLFGLPATTLAMLLMFLAAMDSFATVRYVGSELGRELNPIMLWLYGQGEAAFILFKLLLTGLCVQWIVRRGSHPYARVAALAGLSIYVPVVGLHIVNNCILLAMR
jgi:hypothetical protein